MCMGEKYEEETPSKGDLGVSNPNSDFPLALALQHQERGSAAFTLESSSESESESESESSYYYQDQFLDHTQAGGQFEYLEGEYSNSDQEDMEEDDIDPDELSYEELIALGEIVGEESKGLSPDEISSSLHPSVFLRFPPSTTTTTIVDRCVICQVEYEQGESTVGLIPCDHPYHLDCITTWLQIRKICPICSSEVNSVT